MTQITGGSVTFGRTVQPKEYESKKAEATIAFSVSDGNGGQYQTMLDLAASLAHAKVHQLLGLNGPTLVAATSDKDRLAAEATRPADPPKTRTTRKPPPVENPAPAAPVAADPAAVVEPAPTAPAATTAPAPAADPAAVGDDDLLTGSTPEVTDKTLQESIVKKNQVVKNPQAIRKLITAYTPQDGKQHQSIEIPQDKRAAFLIELEKIGPPAAA